MKLRPIMGLALIAVCSTSALPATLKPIPPVLTPQVILKPPVQRPQGQTTARPPVAFSTTQLTITGDAQVSPSASTAPPVAATTSELTIVGGDMVVTSPSSPPVIFSTTELTLVGR